MPDFCNRVQVILWTRRPTVPTYQIGHVPYLGNRPIPHPTYLPTLGSHERQAKTRPAIKVVIKAYHFLFGNSSSDGSVRPGSALPRTPFSPPTSPCRLSRQQNKHGRWLLTFSLSRAVGMCVLEQRSGTLESLTEKNCQLSDQDRTDALPRFLPIAALASTPSVLEPMEDGCQ